MNALSVREVRELYPIIWTLEGLAINLSSSRLHNVIKELKNINRDFAKVIGRPEKSIALDNAFHCTLTNQCQNKHLLSQLGTLKNLVYRYEFAYMREPGCPDESVEYHNQIIDAIAKNNLNQAIKIVEQNWRIGMNRISQWLDWSIQ